MTITCATLILAAITVLSASVKAVEAAYAHFQRERGCEKCKLEDVHTMLIKNRQVIKSNISVSDMNQINTWLIKTV